MISAAAQLTGAAHTATLGPDPMATLADVIRFRDDLRAARYSGARRFRDQNGEEIEYKGDREMAAALSALEAEIAAAQRRPASTITFRTSKGLHR